jgi:hypothetical protein
MEKKKKGVPTLAGTGEGGVARLNFSTGRIEFFDPTAVPQDKFLGAALAALELGKTVAVLETKEGSSRKITYNSDVLRAMKTMFPSGKEYLFRLVGTVIPYPTDAGGNLLATVSFSPGVATFPEWSALSALFDEVKLVAAKVTFVGGASGLKNIGLVFGYNPNNVSATPASTTAVTNLGDSKIVSSYSTTPTLLVERVRIPRERAWAETTTPAVASPPAGCVGTVDIANGGAAGTVSSTYVYGLTEIAVLLRNRI